MLSLLHKYIAKKFIIYFIATFFSLAGISLLVDVIEMLRRSYDMEVNFFTIFIISLTKIPFLLSQILPFCIIFSTVMTLWSMNRSSELIIYRAIGISAKSFIFPLIILAFIIGIISTTIFNPLVSSMYNKHNHLLDKNGFSSDSTSFLSYDGLWLREQIGDSTSTINTQSLILKNNKLHTKQLSIINVKDDYILNYRLEANSAIIEDNQIIIPKATIFKPDSIPEVVNNYKVKTNISVNQLQENVSNPETISFWSIPHVIEFFKKTGFATDNYQIYYYSLLASPFLLVSFVLVSAPFMLITSSRKGGMFIRIFLSISCGFLLFFLSKIITTLGVNSSLPLSLSVIIPILISSLCGFAAILHYEDG